MEHVVLGLLLLRSRTIYELKDRIEKGLHMIYSSSMGSIQFALKKLLTNDLIEFNEVVEKGKHKKIYSVTEKGSKEFYQWVNEVMAPNQNNQQELAKLYFMGMSNRETRTSRIKEYICSLDEVHKELQFVYEEGNQMLVADEYKELFCYQHLCAKYGMDSLAFQIKWYQNLLKEMEKKPL